MAVVGWRGGWQNGAFELPESITTDAVRQRTQMIFFSTAMQYYVSGRYAVLAGLIPVAGNLLHHAIEMYLKGVLFHPKTTPLDDLKDKFSHNLPKIWAALKTQMADSGLDSFDTLITSLDDFEELRYPDSVLSKGMAAMLGVYRGPPITQVATAGEPVPTYELYLEEIDALVAKIFDVASVNPAFFVARLNTRAREYLKESNVQRLAG